MSILIEAIDWSETARDWSKLRSAHDKSFAALSSRRKEFDALYERAVTPDTSWEDIAQVASMIGEWGRTAAEKLYPQIGALQRKLEAPHGYVSPQIREALQQAVEVAKAWLVLYRELYDKLLKLAAERRPAHAALRARPIEGDIDHEALSREFMARFPKIRAALAK